MSQVEQKQRKKTIPKVVKDLSWNKWIGENVARHKCLCCETNDISMSSFHCGHIIAEANGGLMSVENLRPICKACNLSMGTENMNDFKRRCGFGLSKESPPNEDETDIPVEWTSTLLTTRRPKFIAVPKGKPIVFNGKQVYLVDSSVDRQMSHAIKGLYILHAPGIYRRC
jgi:hypothetical protein